ncbi:hypothetical protein ABZ746_36920 [Streptomyces sp. NPDC020096]
MRSFADRGRVYRRCGCRDAQHHQLGTRCTALATDPDHETWNFAVDLPSPTGTRTTTRRGGLPSRDTAQTALHRLLEGEASGFNADPNQTVADYLTGWLETKALALKPTPWLATATTSPRISSRPWAASSSTSSATATSPASFILNSPKAEGK